MNKLDAELWRSDLYLITVGEWSEKPTSENQLQILPSGLLKKHFREPRISLGAIMRIAFSNCGFVTFQFKPYYTTINVFLKAL